MPSQIFGESAAILLLSVAVLSGMSALVRMMGMESIAQFSTTLHCVSPVSVPMLA